MRSRFLSTFALVFSAMLTVKACIADDQRCDIGGSCDTDCCAGPYAYYAYIGDDAITTAVRDFRLSQIESTD